MTPKTINRMPMSFKLPSGSAAVHESGPRAVALPRYNPIPFVRMFGPIRSGGWSKERRMFSTRSARILSFAVILAPALAAQVPSASDPPRYALPPKEIIDAFDAPGLPTSIVSPAHQVIALQYRRNNPTIAELAQPFYRLAGARINPKTNGPRRTA